MRKPTHEEYEAALQRQCDLEASLGDIVPTPGIPDGFIWLDNLLNSNGSSRCKISVLPGEEGNVTYLKPIRMPSAFDMVLIKAHKGHIKFVNEKCCDRPSYIIDAARFLSGFICENCGHTISFSGGTLK